MLTNIEIKFPLVESAGYTIFAEKVHYLPLTDGCGSSIIVKLAVIKKDAGDCLRELERVSKLTEEYLGKV